jgi:hypothetical protein
MYNGATVEDKDQQFIGCIQSELVAEIQADKLFKSNAVGGENDSDDEEI